MLHRAALVDPTLLEEGGLGPAPWLPPPLPSLITTLLRLTTQAAFKTDIFQQLLQAAGAASSASSSSSSSTSSSSRGGPGHSRVSIMSGDEDDDEDKLLEPGLDEAFKNVERLEKSLRGGHA